jgi:hypothetical protein
MRAVTAALAKTAPRRPAITLPFIEITAVRADSRRAVADPRAWFGRGQPL